MLSSRKSFEPAAPLSFTECADCVARPGLVMKVKALSFPLVRTSPPEGVDFNESGSAPKMPVPVKTVLTVIGGRGRRVVQLNHNRITRRTRIAFTQIDIRTYKRYIIEAARGCD